MQLKNKIIIIAAILFIILPSTAFSSQGKEDSSLTHIVICWLDKSVKDNELNIIINEAKKLTSIPLILDFSIGRAIESERSIVDDSFTFAVLMKFKNKEDMNKYLNHKIHVDFVNEVLKPKVSKIVVYDF